MTTEQMRELDAWIGSKVMQVRPTIRAEAVNLATNGMALWETDTVTRNNVRRFCVEHTEYTYHESAIFPHYTTNPADALAVLKKCAERIEEHEAEMDCVQIKLWDGQWHVCTFSGENKVKSHTSLEFAICQFAKSLFATA